MIIIDIGNYLSDLVVVKNISVTLTSSCTFLIAIVNFIIFKNQMVSEITNFQEMPSYAAKDHYSLFHFHS